MNAIANPLSPGTPLPDKTIVVVGMPGAGKSTIAKRLALRLGLKHADSDHEIEASAGMKIESIFERFGEPEFRRCERSIIASLLNGPPMVLATGGGAFMDENTRLLIKQKGISLWLRAGMDLLLERTALRNDRPLLKKGDPEKILRDLLAAREPVYAQADIVVEAGRRPVKVTVDLALRALDEYARRNSRSSQPPESG